MTEAVATLNPDKEIFVERMQEILKTPLETGELCIHRAKDSFLVDETGVYELKLDRKGNVHKDQILNYPLVISEHALNLDNSKNYVKLEVLLRHQWKDLGWHIYTFISSTQEVINLADDGLDIFSNNVKDVVRYLAALRIYTEAQKEPAKLISRIGWYGDKYMIPGYGDENIYFNFADKTFGKAISTGVGDEGEWLITLFSNFRYQSQLYRFVLAMSFVPILLKPLNYKNSPIISLIGPRGCGKTTILRVAASVWGDESFIRGYSGTDNGLEAATAGRNDCLNILDDTQLSMGRRDSVSFNQNLIYRMNNGQGKLRSDKEGNLIPNDTWHTVTLLTGENSMILSNSPGGMERRLLELYVDEKMPNELISEINTKLLNNYGWGVRRFIQMVSGLADKFGKDAIKDFYSKLLSCLEKLEDMYYAENRHNHTHLEYIAMAMVADFMISTCFTSIELEGKYEDYKKMDPELEETMQMGRYMLEHIKPDNMLPTAAEYYERIISWANSKINYFDEKCAGWDFERNRGDKCGFFDEKYIYIYPTVFDREIVKMYGVYKKEQVKALLRDSGYLKTTKNRGFQRNVRTGNGLSDVVSMICLVKQSVQEDCDEDEAVEKEAF